jgi:hypothetical protein
MRCVAGVGKQVGARNSEILKKAGKVWRRKGERVKSKGKRGVVNELPCRRQQLHWATWIIPMETISLLTITISRVIEQ